MVRYRVQPDALHTRNAFPFSARNWCVSGAGEITTDSERAHAFTILLLKFLVQIIWHRRNFLVSISRTRINAARIIADRPISTRGINTRFTAADI